MPEPKDPLSEPVAATEPAPTAPPEGVGPPKEEPPAVNPEVPDAETPTAEALGAGPQLVGGAEIIGERHESGPPITETPVVTAGTTTELA
jgi:hypothetical protein